LVAAASYAVLIAWHINIGAWMASAGIAGIALGFAAKDSLSNLFAGIFIIVDAPYSLGDFIVLDGELRGAVTAIGFRSTRLLTLDDVEIVVPNSLIGNAQIVNESGGPYRKARVAVTVECAYGTDADQVKQVLLKCADGAPHVSEDHEPMVRFSSFGASGLVHELLVWIEQPRYREVVVDDLNRRIYKAFAAAGIEIPYSKHDVFIKQFETRLPQLSATAKSIGRTGSTS
jgi:small-conductance mechanosensitive channel